MIIQTNFLFYNIVEGEKKIVIYNFFVMIQLKKCICLLQSHNIAKFIYIFAITFLPLLLPFTFLPSLCFDKCRMLCYYIFAIMQVNRSIIFLNMSNSLSIENRNTTDV